MSTSGPSRATLQAARERASTASRRAQVPRGSCRGFAKKVLGRHHFKVRGERSGIGLMGRLPELAKGLWPHFGTARAQDLDLIVTLALSQGLSNNVMVLGSSLRCRP